MQVGKRAVAAALAAALALLAAGCGGGPEVEPDPVFDSQPNVVFFLTDDQNYDQYTRRTMPNVYRLLAREGTTFTNFVTPTPLCCPSRAAMLTGQYGHNNNVLSNTPGYGLLEEPENILPAWLQRVGYQTAYVGKWLNGYEKTVDKHKEEPPGWDQWHTLIGAHGYYDFQVSDNGRKNRYEGKTKEYLTDYINRRAVGMIDKLSGDDPFFLQVSQLAPHVENFRAQSKGYCSGNAVPAPQDRGLFKNQGIPDVPSLNEADVSDKPTFISEKAKLTPEQLERLEERYRCRLETVHSADRGIKEIVDELEKEGELEDTVIIFASDNGTFHGEHRLPGGKGLAYEEAAHMPLVIRVPEQYRGGAPITAEVAEPTANIDLVPTIVDLAGAPSCSSDDLCRVMDGRSLVPLFSGDEDAWPTDRAIATELNLNVDALEVGRGISCEYHGVRQGRWLYVQHVEIPNPALGACVETKVAEQYDLKDDPFELDNLASNHVPTTRAAKRARPHLAELTDQLADCAGIEGRDPEPESGHYCD
jgi:arylsulfatase A-like enzyme